MHFMNLGHTVETAARLIHAHTGDYPTTTTDVAAAFRQTIAGMRPVSIGDEGVRVSFEDDPAGAYLLRNGVFEFLIDVGTSDSTTREAWRLMIADALEYIEQLSQDLRRMVDLLITDIVAVNSDSNGGGSASTIPGLVCISPGPNWSMYDWAESIMHETMHLNLFLADMVYGLYALDTQTLADEQYRVVSAVKIGQLRPLDKAFHAAVVTVPLMWMQRQRGESTLVDLYSVSLRDAAQGLQDKRGYFTDYGQMLVEELAAFADSQDYGYVERSIRDLAYALYKPARA
jgi:HEXXH motif-containing protein